MSDPTPLPAPTTAPAPDGNSDELRSGIWVAKPFLAVEAFPEALVLTEADARLARKLAEPLCLCRRRIGAHVVELLLERGEDRSVDLALRIPTAANQFKDPYILMEAEAGNTREVAVREFQFHLQGRLADADVAAADWAGYFDAAAGKLAALRGAKRAAARKSPRRRAKPAPARKPTPRRPAGRARKAARPARRR